MGIQVIFSFGSKSNKEMSSTQPCNECKCATSEKCKCIRNDEDRCKCKACKRKRRKEFRLWCHQESVANWAQDSRHLYELSSLVLFSVFMLTGVYFSNKATCWDRSSSFVYWGVCIDANFFLYSLFGESYMVCLVVVGILATRVRYPRN